MRISDWSSDVCSSDLGAKEVRALATPLVQRRRVLLRNCREQRACQYIWVDRIGSRRLDQFAELLHLALLQQLRPFVQCFQFRVEIPHLSHLASPFYVSMQAIWARSEERRVGKEWVSTCRSRGPPEH